MSEDVLRCGCNANEAIAHPPCGKCNTHCSCATAPDGEQKLGEYTGMAD